MRIVQRSYFNCFFVFSSRNRLFQPFFLICIIIFLRCAYINTLYNAKTTFYYAHRDHKKLIREDADTTEELPEEIAAGYDRTITKCAKIIDVYPKRKRWHDDALFLKAKATYYKKEMSIAVRRFRRFLKEYPESPFIPEAYLYLGKAYLENDNLQKAEETLQFVLEKYPKLNANEDITLLLAQVAIKREGKSQAIMILEKSLRSVKSDEKKMNITLKLCGLYIDLQLYEKAVQVLLDAPRNKDYQHYLFRMDYYHLICYKKKYKYDKAITLANKMLKNKQYLKYKPKVLLEKGRVLKMMGHLKDAVKVLKRVTGETVPVEIQGAAWYELALIYQHDFCDFDKAKECYEKALTLSPDEKIRAIAEKRIQGIDLRRKYSDVVAGIEPSADTTAPIDTTESMSSVQYKLGEVYWLNLLEPDSALNHFTAISFDSLADSAIIMKSIYARAWILRFIKQDTATADSLCNVIISNCPATLIAKKSQQDIGVNVTIKTREDSANIAFIAAERLYFNNRDPVAAVNAYYKVAKKYADIEKIASESIYAAAWVCDNVLNKNKKALMLYKKLCESFPESDLCINEAKPRVKIVEDTLKVLKLHKKKEKTKKHKPKDKKETMEKDTATDISAEDLLISDESDTSDNLSTDTLYQDRDTSDSPIEEEKKQKTLHEE